MPRKLFEFSGFLSSIDTYIINYLRHANTTIDKPIQRWASRELRNYF